MGGMLFSKPLFFNNLVREAGKRLLLTEYELYCRIITYVIQKKG